MHFARLLPTFKEYMSQGTTPLKSINKAKQNQSLRHFQEHSSGIIYRENKIEYVTIPNKDVQTQQYNSQV